MNLFDIKLKNYIFQENPRNLNLADFIENNYDYKINSLDFLRQTLEKAYFIKKDYNSFKNEDLSKNDKRFFILNIENKLTEIIAKIEYE